MSIVTVTTASRLHFGLFSFGPTADATSDAPRQFGGVGLMIAEPAVQVRVASSDQFTVAGPQSDRMSETVARLVESRFLPRLPPCAVEVPSAPSSHTGLGSGTQVTLAVATAILTHQGLTCGEIATLAAALGRGRRSAIGTYGFAAGGLLCDVGKASGEAIAPAPERVDFPPAWTIVLLLPTVGEGASGETEREAFQTLPAVPREVAVQLREIAAYEILPAASTGDFAAFSAAVFRLNHQSGLCYARVQGGAYASPRAQQWVDRLRANGIEGVGQSSWGPTLFALFPNRESAESFCQSYAAAAMQDGWYLRVTTAANCGAVVEQAT